ncbi:uncharacterized protein [Diabrotica undecimpunctata]|uniref:uncharacterized protein isoform X2 n=1 Tax=Diabrotica undecimpunctata TaxID=50387 RepID=UPI003B63593C
MFTLVLVLVLSFCSSEGRSYYLLDSSQPNDSKPEISISINSSEDEINANIFHKMEDDGLSILKVPPPPPPTTETPTTETPTTETPPTPSTTPFTTTPATPTTRKPQPPIINITNCIKCIFLL